MKYNYKYNSNDYKTPLELYEKALKFFGIDKFGCDVCCSEKNVPADNYFIEGQSDGLTAEWEQYNWCNPPFNECKKWIEKAFKEQQEGNTTCMLIPVRTETKYWHDFILNNPAIHLEWLRKGYKFLDKNNNEMGVFKNALALVYFLAY